MNPRRHFRMGVFLITLETLLVFFLLLILTSCARTRIVHAHHWYNPNNLEANSQMAINECDRELGVAGYRGARAQGDLGYLLVNYPSDLKGCMESKGFIKRVAP